MRKYDLKIIFYIGFFFFGVGFLIALGQYIVYNGWGNWFDFVKPQSYKSVATIDSLSGYKKTIDYQYEVNGHIYSSSQSVFIEYIDENNFHEDSLAYNKQFPCLSYIGNNHLKLRSAKTGMATMGFFFLFYFLIYKFADHEKWIRIYSNQRKF